MDAVFLKHPTGDLSYGGKLIFWKHEYHWFYGDPDDPKTKRDDEGNILPILSHPDKEVVLDNILFRVEADEVRLASDIGLRIPSARDSSDG